jgi:aminoglycoside/choline kinase family phosphotransferase
MSSLHQPSPAAIDKDARLAQLTAWLGTLDLVEVGSLRPASSDASFRRYFRLDVVPALRAKLGDTLIAMDAPPERENVPAFIHVDGLLQDAGVTVPAIVARKVEDGFLLLSDLGTTTYLQRLDIDNASFMYSDAVDALIKFQLASQGGVLPEFDRAFVLREMNLFPDATWVSRWTTSSAPSSIKYSRRSPPTCWPSNRCSCTAISTPVT